MVLKEGREFLRSFRMHCSLMSKFPGLRAGFPSYWLIEDFGAISIGENVSVGPYADIVVVTWPAYSPIKGRLTIGDRVVIGSGANIRAAGGVIAIGNNALLGQKVSLIAANHVLDNKAPYRDLPWDEEKTDVILEENVWIGTGAIILPGCTVGRNSVVAAGSVVTKSIPPNQLWAGVPAKLLRSL
jgi:acetyltransferase-like isoleucine patch superfamily enzyme